MAGPDLAILLLAAGASSRMRGADKLLEPMAGEPLLRRQARAALSTGARVLVTLPPDRPGRAAALAGLPVQTVPVTDAALGLGHSVAAGTRAAAGAAGLMLVPADMALLDGPAMSAMLAAFLGAPDRIWRGMTAAGAAGHPVVFPARLFADLEALTGDRGARAVLDREAALLVPLPGNAAILDLDTPEDWAAFRTTLPPG